MSDSFYHFDDFGHHVELVELRHDIDTVRPRFDLLDQLCGQFHADFRSMVASLLDALSRLIGDEDAGYLIVKEVCMSHIDQWENPRHDRLVQLAIFRFVALEQGWAILGAVDGLGDEEVGAY